MEKNQKQKLNKLIGKPFLDTILIASEPERLLYSDDERLRSFAKGEFNVDGVWTQALLMGALNANTLEKNEYDQMVLKLIMSNYHFISIDADILIEAAKQAQYKLEQPYIAVLNKFADNSDDSILIVGVNFLYAIWKQSFLSNQIDDLVFSFMDAITYRRDKKTALKKLIPMLKARFKLIPLDEGKILTPIKKWLVAQSIL